MKTRSFYGLAAGSLALLAAALCASFGITFPINPLGSVHHSPGEVRLITEDIPRFWAALDKAGTAVDPAILQREYLDPATAGLKDFLSERIGSAEELAETIRKHPKYYAGMREASLRIQSFDAQIRSSFARFQELYPDAVFPDVYFVVGRMNSGGTTSAAGLLIGVEMYGRNPGVADDELGVWHREVLKSVDELPHVVAHELVHYQQSTSLVSWFKPTLLEASLREGSADFVAELISGKHINESAHSYAKGREAELLAEFERRMHARDLDGWLYGPSGVPGRPADMGYWVGYEIAKAYYERSSDKRRALADIFGKRSADAVLLDSGLLKQ